MTVNNLFEIGPFVELKIDVSKRVQKLISTGEYSPVTNFYDILNNVIRYVSSEDRLQKLLVLSSNASNGEFTKEHVEQELRRHARDYLTELTKENTKGTENVNG